MAWGSSFLFIAFALQEFTPTQVGFGRVFVGALVLTGMALLARSKPRLTWRKVGAIAAVGVCLSGAPMVLIPMAQREITSILASLLNATTPLWTALFVALLIPAERVTRIQLVGLLMGATGIGVLLGAWNVDQIPLVGAAFMLAATALYGVGSTLSRMLLTRIQETPTTLAAVQIGLSSLMLAPFVIATPTPAPEAFSLSSQALWGLVLLGALGTSFAYVAFWKVIKIAGATTAASVTYVVPVIATFLGLVVLKEDLHWYEPVGAAVVFAGVALAQKKPKFTAPAPAPR
jgi:drug/metabolite transporter (DMT)-like permease